MGLGLYRHFPTEGRDNIYLVRYSSDPLLTRLRPPSYFCDNETDNGLELHYRSKRRGFTYYTIGQLKAVAETFYKINLQVMYSCLLTFFLSFFLSVFLSFFSPICFNLLSFYISFVAPFYFQLALLSLFLFFFKVTFQLYTQTPIACKMTSRPSVLACHLDKKTQTYTTYSLLACFIQHTHTHTHSR